MDPLLDPEDQTLEEGLLRAGRNVQLSPEAQNRTLAAMGLATVGGAGIAASAAESAKAGWWAWVTSKSGALVTAGVVASVGATAAVQLSGSGPELSGDRAQPPKGQSAGEGWFSSAESKTRPNDVRDRGDSLAQGAAPADAAAARTAEEPAPSDAAVTLEQLSTAESDNAANRPAVRKAFAPRSAQQAEQPAAARQEQAGQLRAELSQLSRAEQALAAGNASQALRLLQAYRSEFRPARLGLEAEVLTIQALATSGARAQAASRAARFVERHPHSPLRARAERFLQ